MQPDAVILRLRIEALECRFVINERDNDLSLFRSVLLAN